MKRKPKIEYGVYICFYEWEGWDNCSPPLCYFYSEGDADEWVEKNGRYATYVHIEPGQEKIVR